MLINIIKQHLSERIEANELTNEECVQLIEHIGAYLNIATIPDYKAKNNLTYNGVKYHRNVTKIFNVRFVIDNE